MFWENYKPQSYFSHLGESGSIPGRVTKIKTVMNAITFFCPVCSKAKMISVIDPSRKYDDDVLDEWIDLIMSGYGVRTMPIEEAKLVEMCYTNHETN